MALMAAPFGINVLYTLGLARFGLGFLLITLPTAYWGGYRLLQLAGVVSG